MNVIITFIKKNWPIILMLILLFILIIGLKP